jgi:hypothetical protein
MISKILNKRTAHLPRVCADWYRIRSAGDRGDIPLISAAIFETFRLGSHPTTGARSPDQDPSRLDDTELAHEFLEVTRRIGCP